MIQGQMPASNSQTDGDSVSQLNVKTADNIINKVLQLSVPEVDMDQYDPKKMMISAYDYAVKKATEFLDQNNNLKIAKNAGSKSGSSSTNMVSGDKSGGSTSSFNISPKTSNAMNRSQNAA